MKVFSPTFPPLSLDPGPPPPTPCPLEVNGLVRGDVFGEKSTPSLALYTHHQFTLPDALYGFF